jgi:hypothetical protein
VREYVLPDAAVIMLIGVALSMPLVPWLRSRIDALAGAPRAFGDVAWLACLFALLVLTAGHLVSGSHNPFIYFRF